MPRNELTQLDEHIFDVRIIERRLRDKKTDRKEYEAYLARLSDDAENVDYIEVNKQDSSSNPGVANDLTFTSG